MSASQARLLVSNWNTVRYELLNTRICDLGLAIEGSPVEPLVDRVCAELAAKGLKYRPRFYLTDSWGCPDKVPAVGIPFYLADKRLARIEEEQTGEVESQELVLMFLRHEVGHALNYAFRLWKRPEWQETFGQFTKPYRDYFSPDPTSRNFVRHLPHSRYGRNYAQKHPDEDFAETFAVWLTPRSGWRRKYRFWPAIGKVKCVARLMREIRNRMPRNVRGGLLNPLEDMAILLARHYGQRAERYRATAQGYVDDKLREAFPPVRSHKLVPIAALIRRYRDDLLGSVSRWSGLPDAEIEIILSKIEDRSTALNLSVPLHHSTLRLVDLTALTTALAMDFAYTGRFSG